jgi:hypothetical protein
VADVEREGASDLHPGTETHPGSKGALRRLEAQGLCHSDASTTPRSAASTNAVHPRSPGTRSRAPVHLQRARRPFGILICDELLTSRLLDRRGAHGVCTDGRFVLSTSLPWCACASVSGVNGRAPWDAPRCKLLQASYSHWSVVN